MLSNTMLTRRGALTALAASAAAVPEQVAGTAPARHQAGQARPATA